MCDVHVLSFRREVIKLKDLACFSAIPETRNSCSCDQGVTGPPFKLFLYNTYSVMCVCVCVCFPTLSTRIERMVGLKIVGAL